MPGDGELREAHLPEGPGVPRGLRLLGGRAPGRGDLTPASVAFYVSGHGFGHAVRTCAVAAELCAQLPQARVHIRAEAPSWIFARRLPDAQVSKVAVDVGVLQTSGLDLDLPGTAAAHATFLASWDRVLERETHWLRETQPQLVVADLPPLAFAAAARAGIPAVGVANFGWDWILEEYATSHPELGVAAHRYARAYAHGERLYRLPLHGDFPAFADVTDVAHVAFRSRREPEEVRAALGLPREDRPLVLVSLGGYASGALAGDAWDDLSAFRFLGLGPPPAGFPGVWMTVGERAAVEHEDLVAASDAVIGKPGYSTCAEILGHGARFLHLPRPGFREVPVLEAGLTAHPGALRMPREDFDARRWRSHLEAVLALPRADPVPADGAAVVADALAQRL